MATLASKRKRESNDMPDPRAAPGMGDFGEEYLHNGDDGLGGTGDDNMGFAAALAQHNADIGEPDPHHDQVQTTNPDLAHDTGEPSATDTATAAMAHFHHTRMQVPQSTEQSFVAQLAENANPAGTGPENGNANGPPRTSSYDNFDHLTNNGQVNPNGTSASPTAVNSHGNSAPKPQVGTDEWHKVRRDNHKEVERRRRETINEGITELSKIVPGCEKNKGSILQRAVQFITQLKENETQNIEKWTLEKLLTEQAIAELSTSCDKLKAECQRAWAECEQWKKAAQKAGVTLDDEKVDANGDDAD